MKHKVDQGFNNWIDLIRLAFLQMGITHMYLYSLSGLAHNYVIFVITAVKSDKAVNKMLLK